MARQPHYITSNQLFPPSLRPQDTNLTDGAGHKPSYSMRTLCRALDYARSATPVYGLQRALYDGFAMSFLTQLSPEAAPRMEKLLQQHLLPGVKNVKVRRGHPRPGSGKCHPVRVVCVVEVVQHCMAAAITACPAGSPSIPSVDNVPHELSQLLQVVPCWHCCLHLHASLQTQLTGSYTHHTKQYQTAINFSQCCLHSQSIFRTPPAPPGGSHVLFEQFWLERGPLPLPELGTEDDGSRRRFVLTPSVRQHLCNIARAVLIRWGSLCN